MGRRNAFSLGGPLRSTLSPSRVSRLRRKGIKRVRATSIERADDILREVASAQGNKLLIMLRAYLDDSGTHDSPHCFVTGYLAQSQRWTSFCEQWQCLCDKYLNGRPFKMRATNRRNDTSYVSVPGIVEFAQCVSDHAEIELWSAVPEYCVTKIHQQYGVRFDRYWLCFIGVLEKTVNDHDLRERGEPLGWTFDQQGGSGSDEEDDLEVSLIRAFNDMRGVADDTQKLLLDSIGFANDERVLPLQAADLIAWQRRRYHTEAVDAKAHEAYAILQKSKMRRIEAVWFDHKIDDLLDAFTRGHEAREATPKAD